MLPNIYSKIGSFVFGCAGSQSPSVISHSVLDFIKLFLSKAKEMIQTKKRILGKKATSTKMLYLPDFAVLSIETSLLNRFPQLVFPQTALLPRNTHHRRPGLSSSSQSDSQEAGMPGCVA